MAEVNKKDFGSYKYNISQSSGCGFIAFPIMFIALLFIGFSQEINFSSTIPIIVIVTVIAVILFIIFKSSDISGKIIIDSSFIILDSKVYYYTSFKKIEINKNEGIAFLFLSNDKNVIIRRENFPTAARKADKIKKNKMQAFNKVMNKIVNKIKHINPSVIYISK